MLSSCAQTDIGRYRKQNEDSVLAKDNLFLVCDGMGGHKAGEIASQIAVETIQRFIDRSADDMEITWPYGFNPNSTLDGNRLLTAVKLANRAIYRTASAREDYTGMGTTASAVLVSRTRPEISYANIGDSRVYLIRDGSIVQLTKDDSWANLADSIGGAGPDANTEMQHVLTKALGACADVAFDVQTCELRVGDILLLCSDGLTNMLSDKRILEVITRHGSVVDNACRELVDAANEAGGRDNISAVLVRYIG